VPQLHSKQAYSKPHDRLPCADRPSCIAHGALQTEVLSLDALSPRARGRVRKVSSVAALASLAPALSLAPEPLRADSPALTRAAPPCGRTMRTAHVGAVGAFSCLLAVSLAVAMQADGAAADDLLLGPASVFRSAPPSRSPQPWATRYAAACRCLRRSCLRRACSCRQRSTRRAGSNTDAFPPAAA